MFSTRKTIFLKKYYTYTLIEESLDILANVLVNVLKEGRGRHHWHATFLPHGVAQGFPKLRWPSTWFRWPDSLRLTSVAPGSRVRPVRARRLGAEGSSGVSDESDGLRPEWGWGWQVEHQHHCLS